MKIKILQTTTTILTEDRQVESTYTNETFILEAEKGIAGDIFVNGDFNNKFKAYFREKV